jgi:cysteine-rich repeat protein
MPRTRSSSLGLNAQTRFALLGAFLATGPAELGCQSTHGSSGIAQDSGAGKTDCSLPAPPMGECEWYSCENGRWNRAIAYCPPRADAYPPVTCGDRIVESDETCDDGNATGGDGCNSQCQMEANYVCPTAGQPCMSRSLCGNRIVTSDETCDDGNTLDGDGCSRDCKSIESGWRCRVPGQLCTPICGDGILKGNEECDDGNVLNGDGCSSTCRIETDLVCQQVDAGSTCDGGVPPICGDGMVSPDEECDDGSDPSQYSHNEDNVYGACTTACTLGPYCGDGMVNGPEECDLGDGNGANYGETGCTFACTIPHFCGDGIVDTDRGERCDRGALNGVADGARSCSPVCEIVIY